MSAIGTGLQVLGYLYEGYTVLQKSNEAYTKAKKIWKKEETGAASYFDCAMSCADAALHSYSFGLLVQKDLKTREVNKSERDLKIALDSLEEKTKNMDKVTGDALENLEKTPSISKTLFENVLNTTESIASNSDYPCLQFDGAKVADVVRDLRNTLKKDSTGLSKALSDANSGAKSTLSDFVTKLAENRALNKDLHQIMERRAMLNMFCSISEFVNEACKGKERFSSIDKNTAITRAGLLAYLDFYPNSHVSQYIKNHGNSASATAIALISGAIMAKTAKKLFQPSTSASQTSRAMNAAPTVVNPSQNNAVAAMGPSPNVGRGSHGIDAVPSLQNPPQNNAVAETNRLSNNNSEPNPLPDEIPENLEDDPILKERICAITHAPIRYPMILTQNDGRTFVFETVNILAWCASCENEELPITNPITRAVIDMDANLSSDNAGRAVINQRLEELRSFWDKSA